MGSNRQDDDDKLVFSDVEESDTQEDMHDIHQYKLLIVDDEKEVHVMTKLVLSDFSYQGSTLQFLSAYSLEEAKKLIKDHPDAACILLDVVMETKDAGLEIAKFIREEQKNELLRIILRTGQPGQAPEKEIILNYDINDYKEKTELTTQKLFTTLTTALRSFIHLVELDKKKKEIISKNVRLNEEIARRIVAEHNLTKYNRSLEKILDSKTSRLKDSLQELEKREKELQKANILAAVGDVSSATLDQLDFSQLGLKKNLLTMNKYRTEMTNLLEKYEVLQDIIYANTDSPDDVYRSTHETIGELNQFKQEINLEEILAKYPEIIKDSTKGIEHISKAVTDIKLFISINDERPEQTDINSLVSAGIKKVRSDFKQPLDLQIHLEDLPKIQITRENMEKAFSEIIKNALQAVTDKGIVSVSTTYEDPSIFVRICDNGRGIASEDLAHVFKPYFTTGKANARGLGLSLAQAVIKNNNGIIEVTSRPGEGTTFSVLLPVKPNDT